MLTVPRIRTRRSVLPEAIGGIGRSTALLSPPPRVRPETVALALGAGRAVIGGALLAAPVRSAQLLGLDTATAKRVSFVARMAGIRDVGIGLGAVQALSGRGTVPWLLVGAAADAVDAAVLADAARHGRARALLAGPVAAGAAAAAGVAVWSAVRLRRGR